MTNRRTFLGFGLGAAAAAFAPRRAREWIIPEAAGGQVPKPTTLILATSSYGDPLNASVPGSYGSPAITHPADPAFAATDVTLGAVSVKGAAMWGPLVPDGFGLPDALRARLAFIHHRTDAVAHSEYDRVMCLRGAVKGPVGVGEEMLPTAIAQELALALDCIQPEPICLGPERMTVGGSPLTPLRPTAIKSLFSQQPGVLGSLRSKRNARIDALYAKVSANGTRAQKAFLSQYMDSRARASMLGGDLAPLLAEVGETVDADAIDGPQDQLITAVALAKLNVAPVITIHLPFGSDNHKDLGLVEEAEESVASIKLLSDLWTRLAAQGLTDSVTFALFNIFGRTLAATNGRSHNPDHNVLVMFGPNVKGGVAGGLDEELRASAFDPASGEASPDGLVTPTDSAAAAGATLMRATGVDPARVAARIPSGTTISALLT
jgi:hypothetical protein